MNNVFASVSASAAIEVVELTRWFGKTLAVDHLHFSVRPGEALGFIGPNGAGKTTTMRILATIDEPDLGDAFVGGFSCTNDPERVRRRLGFMPDAYGAYPNVTCIEYLDFFARSYGLIGRERSRAIKRVLDFTNMHHMIEKPMTGLSKGMKQRLCLGRALIHDPEVLVLDEPAAGLDPRARIELKEMVAKLLADGKTLLISSHILSELAEMCNRVAIIEHGRLLASGTIEEILEQYSTGSWTESGQRLTTITIGFVEDGERLAEFLKSRGNSEVRLRGNQIEFLGPDDAEACRALLHELVSLGFPIHSFTPKPKSLEDAFMKVTVGNIR